MSIDDEIASLESRRDACLSAIDNRVEKVIHDTRETLSITNFVRRFPYAAIGAAVSAGLLASGSQKKIWVMLSRLVGSAVRQRHAAADASPAETPSPPQPAASDKNSTSHRDGFWQHVAPMAQAAVPLLLERVPWGKIRQSIKARSRRPADSANESPSSHDD
ncbi:MAG: hypothetical protein ACP5O1_06595 [Phycisphaerae bacterium]